MTNNRREFLKLGEMYVPIDLLRTVSFNPLSKQVVFTFSQNIPSRVYPVASKQQATFFIESVVLDYKWIVDVDERYQEAIQE